MKKIYSLALALFCVASVGAQTQLPVTKLDFNALPLGACPEYFTDYFRGANPVGAPLINPNGAALVSGGQINVGNNTPNFKSALSIIDGGKMGHILMIKGKDFTGDTRGTVAAGSVAGYVNVTFAAPSTMKNGKYRVSINMKVANSGGYSDKLNVHFKGIGGGLLATQADAFYNSDDAYYIWEADADITSGNADQTKNNAPCYVQITICGGGKFDKTAVYVRSITFTQNPVGSPIVSKKATEQDDQPLAIYDVKDAGIAIATTQDGIVVTAENETAISVFTTTGIEVVKMQAQKGENTIQLNKGIYLVKVGNKTTKIAL